MKKTVVIIAVIFITLLFAKIGNYINNHGDAEIITSKTNLSNEETKGINDEQSFSSDFYDYKNKIHVVYESETIDKNKVKLNIKQPIVMNLKNKRVEDKINTFLKEEIEYFKFNAASSLDYFKGNIENSNENQETYYGFTDYKVMYLTEQILSIVVTFELYLGGTHPVRNNKAYNFHLKTGNILMLNTFFTESIDYDDIILEEIKRQVNEKPDKYFTEVVNRKKYLPLSQKFYLSTAGIVVFFDVYEIAPLISGICEFTIPYNLFGNGIKNEIDGSEEFVYIRETYNAEEFNGIQYFINKPVVFYKQYEQLTKRINYEIDNLIEIYTTQLNYNNLDKKETAKIIIDYEFEYIDKNVLNIYIKFTLKEENEIIRLENNKIIIDTLHKSIEIDNNI